MTILDALDDRHLLVAAFPRASTLARGRLAQRKSIGLTSGTGPLSPDSGCCPLLLLSPRRSASPLAFCVSGRVVVRAAGVSRCSADAAPSRTVLDSRSSTARQPPPLKMATQIAG